MAIREGAAPRGRKLAPTRNAFANLPEPAFVQPELRVLEPGSSDHIRRERLLKIMRDESKPQSERTQAAIEALPLCYVQPDPIVTVTHTFSRPKTTRKR